MNGQIFQIHYDVHSRSGLDPTFIPFDNSACTLPQEREIYVFKHAVEPLMPFSTDHVGFLSWKFHAKTGVKGFEVTAFLQSQTAVDVVLIDPFCEDSTLYRNPWHQSVQHHPALIGLARKIFAGAGFNPSVVDEIFERNRVCYCNFFTANQRFWVGYLQFIRKLEVSIAALGPEEARLFNSRADSAIAANHYSFFFERCLPTYLQMHRDIRVASIDTLAIPENADRAARLQNGVVLRREVDAADGDYKERLMSRLEQFRQSQYGSGGNTAWFNFKYRLKYFVEHKLLIRPGR